MIVPSDVECAYNEERAIVDVLRDVAGTRLRLLASREGWLFDDRIKSVESVLSKLENGTSSMRDIHDFYGAMIVVPTQKHVKSAAASVCASFAARIKDRGLPNPGEFAYDDQHLIAKLRGVVSPCAVSHPSILDREFEIQIHTGVQYAWWRATHDELYKGRAVLGTSWTARRASTQARAALELVDGVLSDFERAGSLQLRVLEDPPPADGIQDWVVSLSIKRRPEDEIRCTETIRSIADDGGVDRTALGEMLSSNPMQSFVASPKITPVQCAIIAMHKLSGDQLFQALKGRHRKVLITGDLLAAYPEMNSLPPEVCVEL